MSAIVSTAQPSDHFEPEPALPPSEQRKLRGHLERIDYATFAANVAVIRETLGPASIERFEQLAVSAARARANWVAATLEASARSKSLSAEDVERLSTLRRGYEELSEAYEAMRRMVERGYLTFQSK